MKKVVLGFGLSMFVVATPSHSVETAVGFTLGTLGPGVEVTWGINEKLNVRGHLSKMNFNLNDYVDGLDAFETETTSSDVSADLAGLGVLLDYYPFAGKFRLSTGLLQNNNEIKGRATVTNEPIGDATTADCSTPGRCYSGDLTVGVDLGGTVPYFGVGYGNAASEGSPLGFGFDVGFMPMDIDVSYELLDNNVGANAVLQSAINREKEKIEKDADKYKLFPFINATVSYQF